MQSPKPIYKSAFMALPAEVRVMILQRTNISYSGVIVIETTIPRLNEEVSLIAYKVYKPTCARLTQELRGEIQQKDPALKQLGGFLRDSVKFDPATDILYFPDVKTLDTFIHKVDIETFTGLGITRIALGNEDQSDSVFDPAGWMFGSEFIASLETLYLVMDHEILDNEEGGGLLVEWMTDFVGWGLDPTVVVTSKRELLNKHL